MKELWRPCDDTSNNMINEELHDDHVHNRCKVYEYDFEYELSWCDILGRKILIPNYLFNS